MAPQNKYKPNIVEGSNVTAHYPTLVAKIATIGIQRKETNSIYVISCYISHISPIHATRKYLTVSSFPPVRRGDSLPSGAILGSGGCRGSGDRADDAARGGRGDLAGARRPGLSRGRRSVRRRRALGGEARVVASILAADAVLLARLDADARWQTGGASSGTLGALGRRGGHPQSPRLIFKFH